jgi:chromosome segregation ATPase
MLHMKTIEIERGIARRTLPPIIEAHSLENEKRLLSTLNTRLEEQLELLKQKKAENDRLEQEIENYRRNYQTTGRVLNSSQIGIDLYNARRGLNSLSNDNMINKARFARSIRELDSLRERINEEIDLQQKDSMKIKSLESQIAQTNDEIQRLKHEFMSKEDLLLTINEKNWRLLQDYNKLADNLDVSVKQHIFLEIDIQSLNEKKKFENELFKIMKSELDKLNFVDKDGKTFIDFDGFYQNELRNIKEKIREDFMNMSEENHNVLHTEYEQRYSKVVEEIEKREALNNASQQLNDETTLNGLNAEFTKNNDELAGLKRNENSLQRKLEELTAKLKHTRETFSVEIEAKDRDITYLEEQINRMKSEAWGLLTISKNIDSEISLYDKLLSKRFDKYLNDMSVLNKISTDFLIEQYKKTVFVNTDNTVSTSEKPTRKIHENEEVNHARFIRSDSSHHDKFNYQRMILIDQELNELRKHQEEFERRRKGK